jgi:hypothetical protein
MSEYYRVLKILAEKNVNERMPCSSLHEIQKFYSIVLTHKYSEIRIFCKDLGWLNNQYLIDLLGGFLYIPWNNIKILLKEDCDLSWLNQFSNNDNLQIRIAKGSYSKPEAKEFAVIDDRCFRFEAPQFGIINFNHKKDSKPLIDAFNEAFKLGAPKKIENNKREDDVK